VKLTPDEYTELLFHLHQSTDWQQSADNPLLWLHLDAPSIVMLAERQDDGFWEVEAAPLDQSAPNEPASSFLSALIHGWTTAGWRSHVKKFLQSALGIDDSTAEGLALALASLEPEEESHDEGGPPKPLALARDGEILRQIVGGGYVRLRLVGTTTFAELSLPTAGTGPLSFGPTLTGAVRPYDGRSVDVFARIAWENPAYEHVDLVQLLQSATDQGYGREGRQSSDDAAEQGRDSGA
jgi:hypothetical protein